MTPAAGGLGSACVGRVALYRGRARVCVWSAFCCLVMRVVAVFLAGCLRVLVATCSVAGRVSGVPLLALRSVARFLHPFRSPVIISVHANLARKNPWRCFQ